MILIGRTGRIARRNVCPNATLSAQIPYGPVWDCTRASGMGCRQTLSYDRGIGAKIHPPVQNNDKLVCTSLLLIRTIFCTRDKTYVFSIVLCTEIFPENITEWGERSRLRGALTAYGLLNALRCFMCAFMHYTIFSVEGPGTITKSRGGCTNPWSLHINGYWLRGRMFDCHLPSIAVYITAVSLCIFAVDMFWPSVLAIIRSLTCIKPVAELNNKLLNLKILCLHLLVSCMEIRSLAFLQLTVALMHTFHFSFCFYVCVI